MFVVENEKTAYWDVDDTLVMHHMEDHPKAIEVVYDDGRKQIKHLLVPHQDHIDELKLLYRTGWEIIVWSAGGYKWAHSVVKALKLEEFVDVVMAKPSRYYDDLPPQEFMIAHNYIPFEDK